MRLIRSAAESPVRVGRASSQGFAGDDALALNLNFMNGGIDSRLSCVRASDATFYDEAGMLNVVGPNVPRVDCAKSGAVPRPRRGLLIEEQRTNYIKNNTGQGATSSTLPTGWSFSTGATGVTASVVGLFSVGGLPQVHVRFSGTPTNSGNVALFFEPASPGNGATSVAVSTPVTLSFFLAKTSGNYTNIVGGGPKFRMDVLDSGRATVSSNVVLLSPIPASGEFYGYTISTPASGNTPFSVENVGFQIGVTAGQPIDVTFAVRNCQLEIGAFPTSLILTAGTIATRARDWVKMPTAPWFKQLTNPGALVCISDIPGIAPSGGHYFWQIDDATNDNVIGQYNQVGQPSTTLIMLTGGSVVINGATGATPITPGTPIKYGVTWDGGGTFADSEYGAANGQVSGISLPVSMTTLALGNNGASGDQTASVWIQSFRYWSRLLTIEELNAETA